MKDHGHVKLAIKNLRNFGFSVEKVNGKWAAVWHPTSFHKYEERDLYSDRELIKLSKTFCKKPVGYKTVKEETHKPFRRKTRQQIAAQNLEDFSSERKMKKNNPWNYD
jgi:hypothetical protein